MPKIATQTRASKLAFAQALGVEITHPTLNWYAVYVEDANGWTAIRAFSEEFFFGDDHGETYLHAPDHDTAILAGRFGEHGALIVQGRRMAQINCETLAERDDSDWETNSGRVRRPVYAFRMLTTEELELIGEAIVEQRAETAND